MWLATTKFIDAAATGLAADGVVDRSIGTSKRQDNRLQPSEAARIAIIRSSGEVQMGEAAHAAEAKNQPAKKGDATKQRQRSNKQKDGGKKDEAPKQAKTKSVKRRLKESHKSRRRGTLPQSAPKDEVKALPVAEADRQGDAMAHAEDGFGAGNKNIDAEGKYLDSMKNFPYEQKIVQIRSHTELCLDGAGQRERGSLQLYPCAGRKSSIQRKQHQEWLFDDQTGKIKAFHGGLCLEAVERNTNGGRVQLWPCVVRKDRAEHFEAQMWEYDAVNQQIRNKEGICLRTPNPKQKGGVVHMWACSEREAGQNWGMIKVGGAQ